MLNSASHCASEIGTCPTGKPCCAAIRVCGSTRNESATVRAPTAPAPTAPATAVVAPAEVSATASTAAPPIAFVRFLLITKPPLPVGNCALMVLDHHGNIEMQAKGGKSPKLFSICS